MPSHVPRVLNLFQWCCHHDAVLTVPIGAVPVVLPSLSPRCCPADEADEGWCRKHAVSAAALRLASIVRAELLEVMQRIELPVSPPAFGTNANVHNIQRALISGYFLKVGQGLPGPAVGQVGGNSIPAPIPCAPQVARDIDGSGNYVMLTHKHVAHLPPSCCYLLRQPPRRLPPWVLYHEFTISQDNCLRVVSEIQPQM